MNGELPKGWVWTRVGELFETTTGNTPSKEDPSNYGEFIPFVKPPELKNSLISKAEDGLSEKGSKLARILPPYSVLVSCIGILGKVGMNVVPVAFNQQINAILFSKHINPKYGFYYFQSTYPKEVLYSLASATTVHIVNKSKFQTVPIPLPPLAEQQRIVNKIEELFTNLDKGVESLEQVKYKLKVYRQAILKYAMEGKLTEKWREENKDKIEVNISSKNETPNLKFNLFELFEIPKGWSWIKLEGIAKFIQYGTSEKSSDSITGLPVIRMGNIKEGKINFDNLKYFPIDWPEKEKYLLEEGDLLFNRTNSLELVGKVAVYKSKFVPSVFASYLIRLKINLGYGIPDFVSFYINSIYGRKYILSVASQQVGQANVNSKKLLQMPLPLPPIEEQNIIVERIEQLFSLADYIEETVDSKLEESKILRQSILKKAFEGKLVPQDPNDEPAEILLENIKLEKQKSNKEKLFQEKLV